MSRVIGLVFWARGALGKGVARPIHHQLIARVVLAEKLLLRSRSQNAVRFLLHPVVCKGMVWEQKESGTKEVLASKVSLDGVGTGLKC